jgi:curli biogenesis system outer membrane secretion channel CsgG
MNWRSQPKTQIVLAEPGSTELSRCSSALGVAAITEADTNAQALTSAGLPRSMAPLMRQVLLQSRCFSVVERGAAFTALENEIRIREQQGQDQRRHRRDAAELDRGRRRRGAPARSDDRDDRGRHAHQ